MRQDPGVPPAAREESRAGLWRVGAFVFLVALAVRWLHLAYFRRAPFFFLLVGDARAYDAWARGLVAVASGRLFGRAAGWAAGLLLAFYAPAIFFDLLLQKAVLDLLLVSLLLLLVASAGWRRKLIVVVAGGLLPVGYQIFRMGY